MTYFSPILSILGVILCVSFHSFSQVFENADGIFHLPSSSYYNGGFAIDSDGNTYSSMKNGGNIMFPTGTTQGGGSGHFFKHNEVGQLEWSFSTGNNAGIAEIRTDALNNIFVTGYQDYDFFPNSANPNGEYNFKDFIARVNPDGSYAWIFPVPGNARIAPLNDGSIAFVVKNDPTGSIGTPGFLGDLDVTSDSGKLMYGVISNNGILLWYETSAASMPFSGSVDGIKYNNGKLYFYGFYNGVFQFGNGVSLGINNLCPINNYYYPMNMYLTTIDVVSHQAIDAVSTVKLKIVDLSFDEDNNCYFLLEHFKEGGTCSAAAPGASFMGEPFEYPDKTDGYIVKTDEDFNVLHTFNPGGLSTGSSPGLYMGALEVCNNQVFLLFTSNTQGTDFYLTQGGENMAGENTAYIVGLDKELNYTYHTDIPSFSINVDGNMQLASNGGKMAALIEGFSPTFNPWVNHNFFIGWYRSNLNRISGKAFKDFNQNMTFDGNDVPVAGSVISVSPDPLLVITNGDGEYDMYVDTGTYELQLTDVPDYYTASPDPGIVTFNAFDLTDTLDLRLIPVPGGHDVSVDILALAPLQVGQQVHHKLIVTNEGTFNEDVSLQFSPFNASFPFSQVDLQPAMLSVGLGYVDTIFGMQPGETRIYEITYSVPTTFLDILGEGLNTVLTAELLTASDEIPLDNTNELWQEVVAAYDPNIKTVNHPYYLDYYGLDEWEWVDYTVHFQNEGNYQATNIRVQDEIEEDLLLESLKIIDYSHPMHASISGRTIQFYFDSILLPAMSEDSEGSKGYVHFKLKRNPNLGLGDSLTNHAEIYFDYNPAIVTNEVRNIVVDNVGLFVPDMPETIRLIPNPTNGTLVISGLEPDSELSIYTLQGNLLQHHRVHSNEMSVDLHDYDSGVYLIHIAGQSYRVVKW